MFQTGGCIVAGSKAAAFSLPPSANVCFSRKLFNCRFLSWVLPLLSDPQMTEEVVILVREDLSLPLGRCFDCTRITNRPEVTQRETLILQSLAFSLPLCHFFRHLAFLPVAKSYRSLSWHFLRSLTLGGGTTSRRSAMSSRLVEWETSLGDLKRKVPKLWGSFGDIDPSAHSCDYILMKLPCTQECLERILI